jgi:hypothetical protein
MALKDQRSSAGFAPLVFDLRVADEPGEKAEVRFWKIEEDHSGPTQVELLAEDATSQGEQQCSNLRFYTPLLALCLP